jgi:hypothetical protein
MTVKLLHQDMVVDTGVITFNIRTKYKAVFFKLPRYLTDCLLATTIPFNMNTLVEICGFKFRVSTSVTVFKTKASNEAHSSMLSVENLISC